MEGFLRRRDVVCRRKAHEKPKLGHGVADLGHPHGVLGQPCGFHRCWGRKLAQLGLAQLGLARKRLGRFHGQGGRVREQRGVDPLDAELPAHGELGGALDGQHRAVAVVVHHGQPGHHPDGAQGEHLKLEAGNGQREFFDCRRLSHAAGMGSLEKARRQEPGHHWRGELDSAAELAEHGHGARSVGLGVGGGGEGGGHSDAHHRGGGHVGLHHLEPEPRGGQVGDGLVQHKLHQVKEADGGGVAEMAPEDFGIEVGLGRLGRLHRRWWRRGRGRGRCLGVGGQTVVLGRGGRPAGLWGGLLLRRHDGGYGGDFVGRLRLRC